MTWKRLLAERRVAEEPSSKDEIDNLRQLARRNLKDAAVDELSDDGRFDCAYSAARTLSSVVVRASGYRVKQPGAHYTTFLALEAADPIAFQDFAAYFDACRTRRNVLNYELPDVISSTELEELIDRVVEFNGLVDDWLTQKFPHLV